MYLYVPTDGLVVRGGPIYEVIRRPKVEIPLGRLGGIPLHAILGGNLAEISLDDIGRFACRQTVLVCASSIVSLSLGLDQLVDAICGLSLGELGGGSPGDQRRQ